MRYFSMLSLSCLTITVLVVAAELYFYITLYWQDCHIGGGKTGPLCSVKFFIWTPQIFNGAGIVFFAYTNQAQMLPIYSELANPVKRRIMKVIRSSTIMVVTIYYIIGTTGYFSTLDNTPEIIMTRPRLT